MVERKNNLLVRFFQEVINDEDLDNVNMKEMRSVFIHLQTALLDDYEEDDIPDEELYRFVL